MADGKVKFWKDGVEVPIEAVPDGTIDASTVASLDQDGTLHILITPEITGTKEAIMCWTRLCEFSSAHGKAKCTLFQPTH